MPFLNTPSGSLHFHLEGQSDPHAPLMVLLHPVGLQCDWWQPYSRHYRDGWRVAGVAKPGATAGKDGVAMIRVERVRITDAPGDNRIPAKLVFDLVYNPLDTMLLRKARSQGCETIDGLEMFLEQAARQFEIFTGESAPRAVMAKAAQETLAAKSK